MAMQVETSKSESERDTETKPLIGVGRLSATDILALKNAAKSNVHHIFAYVLYDFAMRIETDNSFQDELVKKVYASDVIILENVCLYENKENKMTMQLDAANVMWYESFRLTNAKLFDIFYEILGFNSSINVLMQRGLFKDWYLIIQRKWEKCDACATKFSNIGHIKFILSCKPTFDKYLTTDKLQGCCGPMNLLSKCTCKELIDCYQKIVPHSHRECREGCCALL